MFPAGPNILSSYKTLLSFQGRHPSIYDQLFKDHGDVVGLNLAGLGKVIISSDKDFNEHILLKNHRNYIKSSHYDEIKPLLGNGLVTSEGSYWKEQRQKINPLFASSSNTKSSEQLLGVLEKHLATIDTSKPVEMTSFFTALVFDIIGGIIFGDCIAKHSQVMQEELKNFLEISVNRMFQIIKIPQNLRFGSNKQRHKSLDRINKILSILIDEAKPGSLAWVFKKQNIFNTQKELRDELMTLLIAGFETTALALTWSTYLLVKNDQDQKRIRASLESGDSDLLLRHWHESLRLYPSIPQISRHTLQADSFGDYSWDKDTLIMILVYHSQRNSNNYDKADLYDLDRFITPQKSNGAYFPFSLGPRKCLGEQMSTSQALIILKMILLKFEVSESNQSMDYGIEMQVSLKPRKDMMFNFKTI